MNRTSRVAVTSRSFSRNSVLRSELLERYADVTFNDGGGSLEGESLIAFLQGHDKAITALETLDARIFEAVPELRVVSKYGVGLDMIDIDAMEKHGVLLAWTPGVNRRSVAELALGFMIALLHQVPEATEEVRSGKWRQIVGRQLSGRAVGIVGCGHVGKEVVQLLEPFGCRLLVHDIRDYPEFFAAHSITAVSLGELLRDADVVSLHLPLDDSTRNLLGVEQLHLMKRGAVFVNTARGGLVDENEIRSLLESGYISGAAFDVLATEPPDNFELARLKNVLMTPHIGGSAEEAVIAMGRAAISGLENAGQPSLVRNNPH